MPKSRTEWWREKLGATVARDQKNMSALARLGWRVLIVWECQVSCPETQNRMLDFLGPPGVFNNCEKSRQIRRAG
jgi:DNA mismatch endonuclease (patch repair protein)